MLQLLKESVSSKHAERLEQIVIALIGIEIGASTYAARVLFYSTLVLMHWCFMQCLGLSLFSSTCSPRNLERAGDPTPPSAYPTFNLQVPSFLSVLVYQSYFTTPLILFFVFWTSDSSCVRHFFCPIDNNASIVFLFNFS